MKNIDKVSILKSYEHFIKVLIQLFNGIYDSGIIPPDWLKSAYIVLPKKNNARKCKDVCLMSHVA